MLLASTFVASTLLYLYTEELIVSESLESGQIDITTIYGVYHSDLGEKVTLGKGGSYIYEKVLSTGRNHSFSGRFYFSEEEDFESGTLNKVIKLQDFDNPFSVWKNDDLKKKNIATFHLFNESGGTIKFCNYGGLDGGYNCFRPAKEPR